MRELFFCLRLQSNIALTNVVLTAIGKEFDVSYVSDDVPVVVLAATLAVVLAVVIVIIVAVLIRRRLSSSRFHASLLSL